MKVVAILGSHRVNGNSNYIVDKILTSVDNEEVEVEKYYLSDLNIKACGGCFYCRKNEKCFIKDDMDAIINSIYSADKIIISIPIFMFQMSGNLKLLIDRLYPLLAGENGHYTNKMSPKDTILVYSQGSPNEESFNTYIELNNKTLSFLGFNIIQTIICTKSNALGSSKENLQLEEQALMASNKLFKF